MYIYEHDECEPPTTAEEWEMIIALARKKRDPNSIPDRGDPDRDPTNVHSNSGARKAG